MTAVTTSKKALERFEARWQDALAQERRAAERIEAPPAEPFAPDGEALPQELFPQEIAAWLERFAGRCHEAGLLDDEAHARARDCAREQREIFTAVDPAALEKMLVEEMNASDADGR